jgi:hypothetical protein
VAGTRWRKPGWRRRAAGSYEAGVPEGDVEVIELPEMLTAVTFTPIRAVGLVTPLPNDTGLLR